MRWNNAGRIWQMTQISDMAAVHHYDSCLSTCSAVQRCARELLNTFNYVYNQVGVNIFHAKRMMRI